ncbi:unnamed protein product [Bursaphelenchus okinawaensis]|uniref:Uncharacterized protein n=1 Tax=Bursaphelenchus okinawaensis TaxID=465554 RepID=A0A811L9T4_9BILA|nr:unnamed protein product [Bursaphelenchus okinawaensis]CAG9119833.1 unnamed protein product [Bursaphelenchus okinawaensis]
MIQNAVMIRHYDELTFQFHIEEYPKNPDKGQYYSPASYENCAKMLLSSAYKISINNTAFKHEPDSYFDNITEYGKYDDFSNTMMGFEKSTNSEDQQLRFLLKAFYTEEPRDRGECSIINLYQIRSNTLVYIEFETNHCPTHIKNQQPSNAFSLKNMAESLNEKNRALTEHFNMLSNSYHAMAIGLIMLYYSLLLACTITIVAFFVWYCYSQKELYQHQQCTELEQANVDATFEHWRAQKTNAQVEDSKNQQKPSKRSLKKLSNTSATDSKQSNTSTSKQSDSSQQL